MRQRLPNRRPGDVVTFQVDQVTYHATVSWFEDGRPAEVFMSGGKPGSGVDTCARDLGVTISIALQMGADIEVIKKALTRHQDGTGVGPLGWLLDMVSP